MSTSTDESSTCSEHDAALAQLQRAHLALDQAELQLAAQQLSARSRSSSRRLLWLIGGGLLSGLALATVPSRHWTRLAALVLGGSVGLLRSPIGPVLAGAVWTHALDSAAARRRIVRDTQPAPTA